MTSAPSYIAKRAMTCCVCKRRGGDVRVIDCGCTMHVCCTPLELVVGNSANKKEQKEASKHCPICKAGISSGLCLLPLSFEDADRAIDLKLDKAVSSSSPSSKGAGKRVVHSELHDEIAFAILSQGRRHRTSGSADYQRTGRWAEEETRFADRLVWAFDEGLLPFPNGMKLNQCLCDFLLCKLSRLTKKMKNAKLSTRSFVRKERAKTHMDKYASIFLLQESFLESVSSEQLKLELRFNLTRQWRIQFSNLCLQVGYPLQKDEFMASMDELERRVSAVEGAIKKRRRLDMGAALCGQGGDSGGQRTAFGARSQQRFHPPAMHNLPSNMHGTQNHLNRGSRQGGGSFHGSRNVSTASLSSAAGHPDHLPSQSGPAAHPPPQSETIARSRSLSEDFDNAFMTLMQSDPTKAEEVSLSTTSQASGEINKMPAFPEAAEDPAVVVDDRPRDFMDAIAMYMEANNLPFQHADAWVPSHVQAGGSQKVRLLHAGYVTRRDTSEEVFAALNDFGEYSKAFSFDISSGLPGRVYASGVDIWQCRLNENNFERASGAKCVRIKSAVGFPLSTSGVGRMVIMMYSCFDEVQRDSPMVASLATELVKYSPEPKWKLVIEIGKDAPIRKSGEYDSMQKGNGLSAAPSKVSGQNPKPGTQLGSTFSSPSLSPKQNSVFSSRFPDDALDSLQSGSACDNSDGRLTPLSLRTANRMDPVEQSIISLLGSQIPVSETPDEAQDPVSHSSADIKNFIPHCMAIRLLLLRPPETRTENENQIIEILKSSYTAFTNDNKRSGPDLAMLLVRDWICLSSTMPATSSSTATEQPQQVRRPAASSSTSAGQQQQQQQQPAQPSPQLSSGPAPMKPLLPPSNRLSRPPARANNKGTTAHPRRVSVPGDFQPPQQQPLRSNSRRVSTGQLPPLSTTPTSLAMVPPLRRQSTGTLPPISAALAKGAAAQGGGPQQQPQQPNMGGMQPLHSAPPSWRPSS